MTVDVSSVQDCIRTLESSFDLKEKLQIISALADSVAKDSDEHTNLDSGKKTIELDDLFGAWKGIDLGWEKPIEQVIRESRISKKDAPNFDL